MTTVDRPKDDPNLRRNPGNGHQTTLLTTGAADQKPPEGPAAARPAAAPWPVCSMGAVSPRPMRVSEAGRRSLALSGDYRAKARNGLWRVKVVMVASSTP